MNDYIDGRQQCAGEMQVKDHLQKKKGLFIKIRSRFKGRT